MRAAYGVNNISFNGIVGDGTGQTIAIVALGDNPGLIDTSDPGFANSDLGAFDSTFGLPDPPSFEKVGPGGSTDPASFPPEGYAGESSEDVEWAHVIAPEANIVLIEDADEGSALELAGKYLPAVSVVSCSYTTGYSDVPTTGGDSVFNVPASHQPISFFNATGDFGVAGASGFPPEAVAVGGTTLDTDSAGDYLGESAWIDGGGGLSTLEPLPSFQDVIAQGPAYQNAASGVANAGRAVPDVSIDGNPGTGVAVYDITDYPNTGWATDSGEPVLNGGTSLGAPMWAGLAAIVDQGRALQGLEPLGSDLDSDASWVGIQPRLYSLSPADFHDITTGNNDSYGPGYNAGPGYDLATGLGTPVANTLVPDLAGGATVSGRVQFGNSDDTVSGQVFLDLNGSGVQNPNDPVTTLNPDGTFTFTDVIGGVTGTVRLVSPPQDVSGQSGGTFTTSYGTADAGVTLILAGIPNVINDSNNGDTYTLQLAPGDAGMTQILLDGMLVFSGAVSSIRSVEFNFTGTNDLLVIDNTNGSPVPALYGSIVVNGGGAGSGDGFEMIGGPEADLYSDYYVPGQYGGPSGTEVQCFPAASSIGPGGPGVLLYNLPNLFCAPAAGQTISFELSAPVTVTVPPQQAGGGIRTLELGQVLVEAAGAELQFATAPAYGDRTVVVFNDSLYVQLPGGTLDLGGNDAVIANSNSGTFTYLQYLLAGGYAGGAWNGFGLDSSAAAADTTQSTALGNIANSLDGVLSADGTPLLTQFDGVPVGPTDILVGYTYYGDATLAGYGGATPAGSVDFGDLTQVLAHYGLTGETWGDGNFTYNLSSAVNFSDLSQVLSHFGLTMY